MVDIYDYLYFDNVDHSWSLKVEYILKNDSQRKAYKKLVSETEKRRFFLNHFVMNDLSVRQLNSAFLNQEGFSEEFIHRVEKIIDILDNKSQQPKMEAMTVEKV